MRFIRPFEVLEMVGAVANRLALLSVYQVSMRYFMSLCSKSKLQIRLI